ncbi:phosphotransferase [Rickettsiella massiliensis]|uniref:phosphotransferase n=1 Tax=Rickettsiella massiliensis TaxID=676517 RepID=UPI0038B4F036
MAATSFSPTEFVLVHGNLYYKHLLFQQGQLSGVIDWGDMSISHPVVDYAILWSFSQKVVIRIFLNNMDRWTNPYGVTHVFSVFIP